MRSYRFITVDVFTTRHFGGNPLAVFPDAEGVSGSCVQMFEDVVAWPAQDEAPRHAG